MVNALLAMGAVAVFVILVACLIVGMVLGAAHEAMEVSLESFAERFTPDKPTGKGKTFVIEEK